MINTATWRYPDQSLSYQKPFTPSYVCVKIYKKAKQDNVLLIELDTVFNSMWDPMLELMKDISVQNDLQMIDWRDLVAEIEPPHWQWITQSMRGHYDLREFRDPMLTGSPNFHQIWDVCILHRIVWTKKSRGIFFLNWWSLPITGRNVTRDMQHIGNLCCIYSMIHCAHWSNICSPLSLSTINLRLTLQLILIHCNFST